VNYSSIGFAIAHEMIHGFDDQGRKFDRDGNLNDWWAKEDELEFRKRAQLLADQYGAFVVIDTVRLNPRLTLGENVADLGGLSVALDSHHSTLDGKAAPPIDGLTGDQRFFLAFAKLFRGKIRDQALLRMVREDRHPWGAFRVNGTLFDMPQLYEAFQIAPGDRLYRSPEQRPRIW
jgi:putative endopeptidase